MIPSPFLGLVVLRLITSGVNLVSGMSHNDESFRFTSCLLAAIDSCLLALAIL